MYLLVSFLAISTSFIDDVYAGTNNAYRLIVFSRSGDSLGLIPGTPAITPKVPLSSI